MIWYFDLLLFLGVIIACFVLYGVFLPKQEKTKVRTLDGYEVTLKEMVMLEQKRALHDAELTKELSGITGDSDALEPLTLLYGLGMLVVYAFIGSLFNHFLGIPNELFGVAFTLFFFTCCFLYDKACIKRGVEFVQKLSIEAPPEWKQYGAYAKNPFDVYNTLTKMTKEEEQWELLKTRLEDHRLKLSVEDEAVESERLTKKEKELEIVSKRITVHAGLLANSLMTDNPSAEVRAILEANLQKVVVPLKTLSPHYIEVMKEITLNIALPEDVRKQAQELVDAYSNKEVEREKEKMIADALLEIETVKKHIS